MPSERDAVEALSNRLKRLALAHEEKARYYQELHRSLVEIGRAAVDKDLTVVDDLQSTIERFEAGIGTDKSGSKPRGSAPKLILEFFRISSEKRIPEHELTRRILSYAVEKHGWKKDRKDWPTIRSAVLRLESQKVLAKDRNGWYLINRQQSENGAGLHNPR